MPAEPQTEETVMRKGSTAFVGMDVHTSSTIKVSRYVGWSEVSERWSVPFERRAIERLAKRLVRDAEGGEVRCVYEAGPPGFTVKRWMEAAAKGLVCDVAAPSLIARAPGDKVKNDPRDADKLGRQLRSGDLHLVYPPSEAQEAARSLVRVRDAAREDRRASGHRIRTFLLTRGHVWSGRNWSRAHREWLLRLELAFPLDRWLLDELLVDLEHHEQRLARLDAEIEQVAALPAYRDAVNRLRCLRGIDTFTALGLVTTLHNPERFHSPRQLMSYVGLVVSEDSSGARVRRGALTKTGDALARRLLIEAANNQRRRPRLSAPLKARRKGQPAAVVAYADRAMHRLYRRYQRLAVRRGHNIAVAAVARELVGFVWALLQTNPRQRLLISPLH